MPVDITDLRATIVPKLDQLNSEMLLGGQEMTITVSEVSGGSEEQPVIIHYPGENGRPFKPSKTVRKILLFAWGDDGREWVGKSMTLYNDETVRFGGMAVGGIRLRALSHIEKDIAITLTATKGKKAIHTIKVLEVAKPVVLAEVLQQIAEATTRPQMAAARAQAELLQSDDDYKAAGSAYAARVKALAAKSTPAPEPDIPASNADFTPGVDETPPYE